MAAISELGSRREQFVHVRHVVSDLAHRTTSRLLVEHLGLSTVNTPLGGWGGLTNIEGFWGDVEEGSRTYFTNQREVAMGRGIVEFTRQEIPAIFENLGFSVDQRIHRSDERPTLPAIAQVVATLVYLGSYPQVRLDDLDTPEYAARIGDFAELASFWGSEITPDYFWNTLKRLRDGVHEALFTEGPVRNVSDIVHAAHFFVAGEKITRQITDALEDNPNTVIHLPNDT